VIRTGKPVIFPEVNDLGWLAGALGAEHPELLRELGARSYVSVPLRGRTGVIGAISLVRGSSDTRYGAEDLAVAEGLGQRAGLAIENARLYVSAREAVVARDDFLAIAAHELRTPLSTLNLQLQTLAAARGAELAEAVAAGKLERAIKQTRRLASLIDSLLEVSRITAGTLTLHGEESDLSEIVRDVVQRLGPAAEAAGCALTVRAEEPVKGLWDPLRLDQVVTNLLQNAIRYAPGVPIELSVEGDARHARLSVRDHGPGIPREWRARIFDRFEKRGGQSQEGLGLGLYIARQIVEAHGGAIRIESEPGEGTRFVIELPRERGGGRSA
jgi:signal transduction histidine kinase